MDMIHAGKMDWGANLASHRQGEMAHKVLFEGEEGSPDNYLLVLAREGASYYSPRHRHAWDQVRFCLEGSVPIGKDLRLDAGEVGYFPEGVPYGPQEGGPDRIVLLLQFAGAGVQSQDRQFQAPVREDPQRAAAQPGTSRLATPGGWCSCAKARAAAASRPAPPSPPCALSRAKRHASWPRRPPNCS